jgi:hypothetical protein
MLFEDLLSHFSLSLVGVQVIEKNYIEKVIADFFS